MNDLPVGRSVDETLRLVQAFQYTDQHGEVCPAGWKPGDKTVCIIITNISITMYPFNMSERVSQNHFCQCNLLCLCWLASGRIM